MSLVRRLPKHEENCLACLGKGLIPMARRQSYLLYVFAAPPGLIFFGNAPSPISEKNNKPPLKNRGLSATSASFARR
jgi:hypothetical protein